MGKKTIKQSKEDKIRRKKKNLKKKDTSECSEE